MRGLLIGILVAAMGVPAVAQDLPGRRDALRVIFDADTEVESVVFPHDSLNDGELQLLSNAVAQGLLPAMDYYGALAIAPDQGLADPATTTAVGNFHDADSADLAARSRCNAERPEDSAECVTVLIVRPLGWEAGAPLQLSSGASDALRREFRREGRPRYFAISDSTGQWGIGDTPLTSTAACGVTDCRVVVADE